VTFVDEIGFECQPGKLCAADVDVVLRRAALIIAT
jgi:hypothetical protein